MSTKKEVMLLVDGTALAYQSFYALQNLKSPTGRPTGAVYGFFQTIQSLREEYRPRYLTVVMDRGVPEERTQAFAEYKADRPPTPNDLLEQLPLIEELMTVLGIGVLSKEGIEADDILATLAEKAPSDEIEVFIFSPDKDMLQLVDDHIRVIRRHGSNTKVYDRAAVLERYGCLPERFPDLLGLMGDKVDNIPGVPGVGEKTAASLLQEFGTLDDVLEKVERIGKPKLRENLQTHREQAILSRDLAVLNAGVDVEVELEDLEPVEPDWPKALNLFQELGFRRAAEEAWKRLDESGGPSVRESAKPEKPETNYRLVTTETDLEELVGLLSAMDRFGLDTETTGVDSHTADLVGICFGSTCGQGWYVPVAHRGARNVPLETLRRVLGPLLGNPEVGKIGHHLKYDARILGRHQLPTEGWCGDTMVLAHLLHSQLESLKLDDLVRLYLERPMIPISELLGDKKTTQITMDFVEVERAAEYGAEDAEATVALHEKLEEELAAQELGSWYREVEIPLTLALLEMESLGVRIDPAILRQQADEVQLLCDQARDDLFALAGREFNPNSPKQLATILFDERGVPGSRNRSTRQEVLEDLARAGEPLAAKVTEYRQLTKLKSTYLDALPNLVHPGDGRLHTSYNSTVANTGRISSSNPNLQNIPIRTDLGKRVRQAFVADRGCFFVSADYSQIELRVLAHFSRDPGFLRAFQEGQDIHSVTASEIFEVPPEEVDKNMRRKAKEINFGLNYGMSSFGLASRLGISRSEARTHMDRYFSRYPKIKEYFDRVLEEAERDGYVQTLAGRRVEIPRPRSRTGREARAALNAPIQGSAADILRRAMVELREELRRRKMRSAMVLTVHDEIVLEVPESEVADVQELLPRVMVGAFELSVPVEVELRVGRSWAELG